jgi:hypothetical protein
MTAMEFGELLDCVEDARQRLQGHGVLRIQRRIVGRQSVPIGHNTLHQAVERRRPADDEIALAMVAMPACDHLPHDFMDREAVHLSGAPPGVAGKAAAGSAEAGYVAAADPRGQEPQQDLPLRKTFRRLLRQARSLKRERRDKPV